jgi:RNA polymerase primary sigma factor
MDKKVLFNQALASLVEFCAANGNEITMKAVNEHFKDIIDDESQYQFIYDYLSINQINVKGFTPTSFFENESSDTHTESEEKNKEDLGLHKSEESEEEISFVKMYLADIEKVKPLSDEEKALLIESLLSGDASVSERLIEGHLSLVAQIAENFRGKGVSYGDLIQEGNIGLMIAISEYNKNCDSFDEFITKKITDSIELIISEQIHSDRIGQHLADKLNLLDKTTKELNEKLGRVPDLSELSESMGIDEEEVALLLKTSLDTLSINEDTNITDTPIDNEDSLSDSSFTTPSSGSDPLTWRHNKSGK